MRVSFFESHKSQSGSGPTSVHLLRLRAKAQFPRCPGGQPTRCRHRRYVSVMLKDAAEIILQGIDGPSQKSHLSRLLLC
jgi:hypothetical protein